MNTSLQDAINAAKQYMTSETAMQHMTSEIAMQSFMMVYDMLNDDEQVKFIEQLETKISELKK